MRTSNLDIPPRYLRVARLVGEGVSYKEAAHRLNLSINTVRYYTRRLAERIDDPQVEHLPAKTKVMRWWLEGDYDAEA